MDLLQRIHMCQRIHVMHEFVQGLPQSLASDNRNLSTENAGRERRSNRQEVPQLEGVQRVSRKSQRLARFR